MKSNLWIKILVLEVWLLGCASTLQTQNSPDQLASCQAKLTEWKDWAARNVPKCEECSKENDRLSARNERLEEKQGQFPLWIAGACAFGLGAGVYSIALLARLIRRMRPFSQSRKKLFTLLGGAIWVTLSVFAHSGSVEYHPINALAGAVFWSLPVLFLAGILFWWFNRPADQTTI